MSLGLGVALDWRNLSGIILKPPPKLCGVTIGFDLCRFGMSWWHLYWWWVHPLPSKDWCLLWHELLAIHGLLGSEPCGGCLQATNTVCYLGLLPYPKKNNCNLLLSLWWLVTIMTPRTCDLQVAQSIFHPWISHKSWKWHGWCREAAAVVMGGVCGKGTHDWWSMVFKSHYPWT